MAIFVAGRGPKEGPPRSRDLLKRGSLRSRGYAIGDLRRGYAVKGYYVLQLQDGFIRPARRGRHAAARKIRIITAA
jgi:hypothetical protein